MLIYLHFVCQHKFLLTFNDHYVSAMVNAEVTKSLHTFMCPTGITDIGNLLMK